ncbi:hypothetical protein VNO78_06170 [Psophocarpus tetragonolobus]|uniref:Uncharacterized protein n=1 Tax=Psophocarpus tetragonolobus TaxID=3891 RepID=A0AAN9T1M9_PSOTE
MGMVWSCHHLLRYDDDINVVKRCVEVVSTTPCSEANFPSHSPPNWWTEELVVFNIYLRESSISDPLSLLPTLLHHLPPTHHRVQN